jgi:fermentation-respiration switch protein FrsA (DUF1100 family)
MVDVLMPPVAALKTLVLRIGWDSLTRIATLPHPILFVSGAADELVPPAHMERLYATTASSSRHRDWFSVPEGTHNDTWVRAGTGYYRRLKAFLLAAVTGQQPTKQQRQQLESDSAWEEEGTSQSPASYLPTLTTSFQVR